MYPIRYSEQGVGFSALAWWAWRITRDGRVYVTIDPAHPWGNPTYRHAVTDDFGNLVAV